MNMDFRLDRATALARLDAVIPRLGRAYAMRRNSDSGPGATPTTSVLSPYLRRRLLLEQEVVGAALAAHGMEGAGKFIDEVFWRAYFKGHLETRPAIWTDYLGLVAQDRGQVRGYEDAVAGRTGIEGFDDWAHALVQTGWLHNHTRMWFASIWIFTLGLPWALGADFFLRHLIDGDPASNTLSWRWVAGLHTRGRAYAARAENIRRYTDGRFSPRGLNEDPVALEEANPAPLVALPRADAAPAGEVALLLHLDDLHAESLDLGRARVVRVGGMLRHAPGAVASLHLADEAAMQDGLTRAGAHFGCEARLMEEGWAEGLPVVTAWAPVGPSAADLPEGCVRVRRRWDELCWPESKAGFFKMRKAIPYVLNTVM